MTNQPAKRPRQEGSPAQRSSRAAAEGCHREGQSRRDIVHVNILPYGEEIGGEASNSQPEAPQRLHQAQELRMETLAAVIKALR